MTNWQRKSDYLLREIVKFRTYMDSLATAQKAKTLFDTKKAALADKRGVSPVDSGLPPLKDDSETAPKSPQLAE